MWRPMWRPFWGNCGHRQSLAAEAYSLLSSRLRGNGLGGWADDAQDMMNDDSDDDEEDGQLYFLHVRIICWIYDFICCLNFGFC